MPTENKIKNLRKIFTRILLVSHPYVQSQGYGDIAKPLLEKGNKGKGKTLRDHPIETFRKLNLTIN